MKKIYPNDYSTIMRVRYHGLDLLKKKNSKAVVNEFCRIEKLLKDISTLDSPLKEKRFVEGLMQLQQPLRVAA